VFPDAESNSSPKTLYLLLLNTKYVKKLAVQDNQNFGGDEEK
jgi:hypothetical protein